MLMKQRHLFKDKEDFYDNASMLEEILDMIPAVIVISEVDNNDNGFAGQIIWLNRYAGEYLGYNHDEIQQSGTGFWASIIHPENFLSLQHDVNNLCIAGSDANSISCPVRILHNKAQYRKADCCSRVFKAQPDGTPRQLIFIFSLVHGNNLCLSMDEVSLTIQEPMEVGRLKMLSKREKEILHLITQGLNDESIGSKLFISQHTVHTHRNKILKKTGIKNTASLVALAVRYGLSYCFNYWLIDLCLQNDLF
jgi:Response regulator containing a CheY-like receiver domain and an HTH DNA-binding domain